MPPFGRPASVQVLVGVLLASSLVVAEGRQQDAQHVLRTPEGRAGMAGKPQPEPEDPCAGPSGAGSASKYDLALHVAAVGILLGVSLLGSLGPVVLRLSSGSTAISTAIRLGTFFGFGTILSTAFIHMMLPATRSFASPCLPPFWTSSYDAWAYLFVTLAVLLMHLIDYLIKGHHLQRQVAAQKQQQQQQQPGDELGQGVEAVHGHLGLLQGDGCHDLHVSIIGALSSTKDARTQQARVAAATVAREAEAGEQGESSNGIKELQEPFLMHGEDYSVLLHRPAQPQPQLAGASAGASKAASQIMGLYLAEAGIIFHSVMIGLTLGVTAGTGFTTLLTALSFHQFFEACAIGSAAVDSGLGVAEIASMGLAFSVTTPAGIAIGIALRESFNRNAVATLLASGICDALSAGILIYTVLCDLITPAMTDSRWLRSQSWPLQVATFLSFYAGGRHYGGGGEVGVKSIGDVFPAAADVLLPIVTRFIWELALLPVQDSFDYLPLFHKASPVLYALFYPPLKTCPSDIATARFHPIKCKHT